MVYLESKKTKTATYISFVKKITFINKQYTIKKYIGTPELQLDVETYLLENINGITEKECNIRKEETILHKFGYNKLLPL